VHGHESERRGGREPVGGCGPQGRWKVVAMGRLVYSMNVSADGFVADADGEFGWGEPDEEVLAAINEATAGAGTYLYGRRIYELMHVWETEPEFAHGEGASGDFARIWQRAEKIVYSPTRDDVLSAITPLKPALAP